MFFRKYKKIQKLEARVTELEELLCPFNQHDWVKIDYHLETMNHDYVAEVIHLYKCKRCKKCIETIRRL